MLGHKTGTESQMHHLHNPNLARYVVQRFVLFGVFRDFRSFMPLSSDVISDLRVNVFEENSTRVIWYKVWPVFLCSGSRSHREQGTLPLGP